MLLLLLLLVSIALSLQGLMAVGTFGQVEIGMGYVTKSQLLGLGIEDDDGIVMTAKGRISWMLDQCWIGSSRGLQDNLIGGIIIGDDGHGAC